MSKVAETREDLLRQIEVLRGQLNELDAAEAAVREGAHASALFQFSDPEPAVPLEYQIEHSPLGVVEWDEEFRICRWAGQSQNIFQWSPREVIGKHFEDFALVHVEDEDKVSRVAAELLGGTVDSNKCLNRNYRKDGSVVHCEWFNSVLRDSSGRVRSLLSLVNDVTARVEAEQESERTRQLLKSVVLGTSGAVGTEFFHTLVAQLAGSLGFEHVLVARISEHCHSRAEVVARWANGQAADPSCPIEHSLVGTPFEIVVQQDACVVYTSGVQQAFPQDELLAHFGIESYLGTRLVSSSGKVLGVLAAMGTQPMDPSPETSAIIEIFAGRASAEFERLAVEGKLNEERSRQKLALDAGRIGTWGYDVANDRMRGDEQMLAMFGMQEAAVDGAPLSAFLERVNYQDRGDVASIIQLGLMTGEHHSIEFRVRSDEGERWVAGQGSAKLDADGKPLRAFGAVADITDRKLAEQSLRESESRLRILTEQVPAILWTTDLDLRFTMATGAGLKGLGLSNNELVGGSVYDYLEGGGDASSYAEHRAALGGRSVSYTMRWQDCVFQVYIEPLRDGSGEIIGTIGVGLDVTELKQTQEFLVANEARFRALVENSHDVISLYTDDLECVYVSPAVERVLGLQPRDLIRIGVATLTHPDDEAEVAANMAACLSEPKATRRFTVRLRHSDGQFRILDVTAINLLSEPGIRSVVLVHHDVTKRRRAELALKESEGRFKSVVEHAPEAVVVLDLESGRFVMVNAGAERLYRLSKEDLYRCGPLELSPPIQADGRASYESAGYYIDQAVRGELPVFEWTHLNSEGTLIPCEIRLLALELNGRKVVRGSITDISERKRAEEALRQKETELAHVARVSTMGEMVGGIAHELNQPLYAIQNYGKACQNLLDAERSADNLEEVGDWLEEITTMAEFAGDVLTRLRNFVNRMPSESQALNLADAIDTAITLTHYEAKQSGVRIERIIQSSQTTLVADSVQVQQVLVNLLRNAIDAVRSQPNGSPEIAVRVTSEENFLVVTVSDNGSGLPSHGQIRIFDAFKSTKSDGMGLGLAISKTIVESHGGTLTANNRAEGGAEFRVRLPINSNG